MRACEWYRDIRHIADGVSVVMLQYKAPWVYKQDTQVGVYEEL